MIKKSLLILMLSVLIVIIGNTQSIELYYEGSLLSNDTIEIQGDVNADTLYTYIFQGDTTYYYNYEVLSEIDVKNISTNTLNIHCKKRYIQILNDTENIFCWLSCFPPYTFESIIPTTIQSDETTTIFSGHYKPRGQLGCSLIAYTFFDDSNNSDSAMVVVKYIMQDCIYNAIPENTLVNNGFSLPYPNPTKEKIFLKNNSFDFKTGFFELYNNLGVIVKTFSFTLNNNILEFSTKELKSGIYFYKIFTDNVFQKSGMINILH
ncbi:MAG: T9SS type A sorting domain-containing protein [Bacteroidales bacterium]|nr:T9SS type A sorting domain-containing protein [Bacteroidales bacterium]